MIGAQLILLLTITNAIISEELNNNETQALSPEPKSAFKFEGESYGLIRFEDENRNKYNNYEGYNEYNEAQSLENKGQSIKFEDENVIENQRPNHQKKKRRRRKPKRISSNGGANYQNGVPGSFGRPGPVYPGVGPGYPGIGPGYPGPGTVYPGSRPAYPGQGYPSYPGPLYKPRPSPTSAALSAVTEALTSIALYDDRQCVPRLLCEAAGGSGGDTGGGTGGGSGTASGLLQSIGGLQPLLTLLAAYNGISSSPLFVFGRAVFLGMTSKANLGTCRYAYPDCPNDPEQLVHYLNNHNGGFFRFFAAPELNQQQGLEQFYNQLSGQNYGYYQPQQGQGQVGYGQLPQNHQQNPQLQLQGGYQQSIHQTPNLQQQNLYQNPQQTGYGHYPLQQNLYPNLPQVGYDQSQMQSYGYKKPNLYGNSYGFYGKGYPYQQNGNLNRFKNNEIQKRIQNSPSTGYVNNIGVNSKWLFPESNFNVKEVQSNVRLGKVLKFPDSDVNSVKAAEGFSFPGIQSNREYLFSNIEAETDDFKDGVSGGNYNNGLSENRYHYGFYVHESNGNSYDSDNNNNNNIRTLYIVRGNGDPNNPEVVHLAPGQTL